MNRRQRGEKNDERGALAIITVLVVCSTLTAMVTILFQLTLSEQSGTSVHLYSALSFSAAEGGVDLAESTITDANLSTLPCGSAAQTGTVGSTPVPSTYSESITYYDTFPPTDAALSCSAVTSGSATPLAAEIISTGKSVHSTSYMEALLKLTVSNTSVFTEAMFSNASTNWQNSATIYGSTGNNANVYTNANMTCANSTNIAGSVTVQGSFTGQNSCVIAGNLTAVGNILGENSTEIQGSASSTGNSGCGSNSTEGNISLTQSAQVVQSAYAYCSISLQNSASIGGSQAAPDAGLSNPPAQTFPTVTFNSADWAAAGYTNQVTDNVCSGTGNVYSTINSEMDTTSAVPTVIITSCALDWQNSSSVTTYANLAIFSTGGFTMQNSTTWQSGTSSVHDVYLIVPTGTSCTGSTPGNISLQNSTTFQSSLDVLFYTPCTMTIQNSATGHGQVYAGTISVANSFTAWFVPMPGVPGATGGAASTSGSTVSVGVSYIRQITSPAFE